MSRNELGTIERAWRFARAIWNLLGTARWAAAQLVHVALRKAGLVRTPAAEHREYRGDATAPQRREGPRQWVN